MRVADVEVRDRAHRIATNCHRVHRARLCELALSEENIAERNLPLRCQGKTCTPLRKRVRILGITGECATDGQAVHDIGVSRIPLCHSRVNFFGFFDTTSSKAIDSIAQVFVFKFLYGAARRRRVFHQRCDSVHERFVFGVLKCELFSSPYPSRNYPKNYAVHGESDASHGPRRLVGFAHSERWRR